MNDNRPYKSRVINPWPVFVLMLFFGAAISLWGNHHVLSIIVGVVGIIIFVIWDKVRTKYLQEEFSFRGLFKDR